MTFILVQGVQTHMVGSLLVFHLCIQIEIRHAAASLVALSTIDVA